MKQNMQTRWTLACEACQHEQPSETMYKRKEGKPFVSVYVCEKCGHEEPATIAKAKAGKWKEYPL